MSENEKINLSPSTRETFNNMTRERVLQPQKPTPKPVPTISEMQKAFSEIRDRATANPRNSLYEVYKRIHQLMPTYIRAEVHAAIAGALHSNDEDKKESGMRVAMDLAIPAILTGINAYRTGQRETDDHILQEGLLGFSKVIYNLYHLDYVHDKNRAARVNATAANCAISYRMLDEQMEQSLVIQGKVNNVKAAVDQLFENYPYGLHDDDIAKERAILATDLNVPVPALGRYIALRNRQFDLLVEGDNYEELFDLVENVASTKDFALIKETFGIEDEKVSLNSVGNRKGISAEGVRQQQILAIERIKSALFTSQVNLSEEKAKEFTIGQLMKDMREDIGLSLKEMAEIIGLSNVKRLISIEKGESLVNLSFLRHVEEYVGGITVADIKYIQREEKRNRKRKPKRVFKYVPELAVKNTDQKNADEQVVEEDVEEKTPEPKYDPNWLASFNRWVHLSRTAGYHLKSTDK